MWLTYGGRGRLGSRRLATEDVAADGELGADRRRAQRLIGDRGIGGAAVRAI